MAKKDTKIVVNSMFSEELELRARLTAARLRVSRSEIIRRATEHYLQHLEQQEKPTSTIPALANRGKPIVRVVDPGTKKAYWYDTRARKRVEPPDSTPKEAV